VDAIIMNETPADELIPSDRARASCRSVVGALMARGAWAIVSEDELVERVWRAAGPDASPGTFVQLAKYHYSALLHAACLQNQDLPKRELAFGELHRFLYRAAYNRWPELAEDATQRALVLVYEQIGRCREPGTFLAFALNKLRHAFQQERRARQSSDASIDEDELALVLADGDPDALEQHLLSEESTTALLQAVERLADLRQRSVVLWKFLGGLSDEDIGQRLGIQPGHVRVLRHRGLGRLRADVTLRDALSDESLAHQTERS
jgi:RNA polymerase sigma-70 factor (ECF subfamily)